MRNKRIDILALGSRCTKCGADTDQACKTPSGAPTEPHQARIDRAVRQF